MRSSGRRGVEITACGREELPLREERARPGSRDRVFTADCKAPRPVLSSPPTVWRRQEAQNAMGCVFALREVPLKIGIASLQVQ
jgi:hypothetical protein